MAFKMRFPDGVNCIEITGKLKAGSFDIILNKTQKAGSVKVELGKVIWELYGPKQTTFSVASQEGDSFKIIINAKCSRFAITVRGKLEHKDTHDFQVRLIHFVKVTGDVDSVQLRKPLDYYDGQSTG